MHPEASFYVRDAVHAHVGSTAGVKVVEFGSFNVNGTVRDFFPGSDFFGIDTRDGKDVDFVCDASEFDGEEAYDVVITSETLEHAERPAAIVKSAWSSLVPGGVFIVTAASPERTPHNCNGDHGAEAMAGEHYAGIQPDDLTAWLHGWDVLDLTHDPSAGDVRAVARKPHP